MSDLSNLSMEQVAELAGVRPLARLVPLEAPEETELEFYRRKAYERGKALAAERAKNQRLTLRILALLDEEA